MSKKTINLHIGYHKTGTTFLQGEIFPNLQSNNFIKNKNIYEELRRIRRKKLSQEEIKNLKNNLFTHLENGNNLISWEGLCGNYFFTDFDKNFSTILGDLNHIFKNFRIKIILGIREQVSLITSLYKLYLHVGGTQEEYKFIDNLNLDKFKFTNYISALDSYFSFDNVYVYYFENFVKDKNTFLSNLLEFLGENKILEYDDVIRNRGYGELQVKLAKILNRCFKSRFNSNGIDYRKKIPRSNPIPRKILQNKISYYVHYKKYRFPLDIRKKLKNIYIEDNKRLKEKYLPNLPLEYTQKV